MLLSFSIDAMLPMVVNGIRKAQAEGRGELEPDVEDWLAATFPAEAAAAGQRIKAQTIRADNPTGRSAYAGLQGDARMDLWRKSRTPGRMKLGWVLLRVPPAPLRIQRQDGGACSITADGVDVAAIRLPDLALADGFDSAEAFKAFFVPNPGDVFRGWLLRW